MRKKTIITLLFCIVFSISASKVFGQETTTDSVNKKITIKLDNKPLWEVCRILIEKYDVAIGFEESTLDNMHNDFYFIPNLQYFPPSKEITIGGIPIVNDHLLTIDIENGSLEDALDLIVKQMKNYKWEINDEVVNIYPINGRDERFKNLLELKIDNFEIKKPVRIFQIRQKLFELPEVEAFMKKNKFFYGFYRDELNFIRRPLASELKFSNLTLRELLNKITKIKRGGWILKMSDTYGTKEKEYIDFSI